MNRAFEKKELSRALATELDTAAPKKRCCAAAGRNMS